MKSQSQYSAPPVSRHVWLMTFVWLLVTFSSFVRALSCSAINLPHIVEGNHLIPPKLSAPWRSFRTISTNIKYMKQLISIFRLLVHNASSCEHMWPFLEHLISQKAILSSDFVHKMLTNSWSKEFNE